jgi:glycosyltransferase involved in cell wall biosynthesis
MRREGDEALKVVHVIPGAGDTFYCQNCVRDLGLVRDLRAAGADVIVLPIYLPLPMAPDPSVRQTPVFYGAASVYLEQRVPALARRRGILHRWLDSAGVLRFAAGKSGATSAAGLEDLTASVLRGEDGRQAVELERVVQWLAADGKPDVVHLSNALLLGLARRLRAELGCAVVCSLQDEDVWIDAMPPDAAARLWSLMADKARDADLFISVSRYFADLMTQRLRLDPGRIRVVPPGVPPAESASLPFDPPAIGYLSRMAPGLGLDVLVDAWLLLRKKPGFERVRLRATGGQLGPDRDFVKSLERRAGPAAADAVFAKDYSAERRGEFLRSVTVLCVPAEREHALGLYVLEALAAGVPAVQPRSGAFPEILEATGGGALYEPNTPEALAEALVSFLSNPEAVAAAGRRGREHVANLHGPAAVARRMIEAYRAARAG